MNRKPFVSVCAAFALGAFPICLVGQTAAPGAEPASAAPGGATPAPAEQEDEDIVTLNLFEVSADTNTGYQASETLAGTRIRTSLRDVGSAISVVTPEFMRDIAATDNSSLLQYTTNAEVAGTRGTYAGLGNGTNVDESSNLRAPGGAQNRVRGLAAADNTRDFYVTDIPWDFYNVDRIDIQRGPNSILFGLGSPAGIVNASLRNASFRSGGMAEARFGSYGSWRGSIDYNHELVDDVLAVRIAGLWDHEKFQQEPAFEDDERYYGALRFDPKLVENGVTSLKIKYEHGDIDANRPRIIPPNDSLSPWFRPLAADQTSWGLGNGMGRTAVNNGYDANRSDLANILPGTGLGLQTRNTANPNYQPWLSTAGINQQQPFWLLDGSTGQTYRVVGGYINPGARLSTGATRSASDGLLGRRYADQFFGLNSLPVYANNASLPLSGSGQFRTESLRDPSVFDFYETLIDGPNKSEFERWDAYNIDLSQTVLGDRVGVQLTYDRQKYTRGGEALLGGSPTLTLDILRNFQDFYLSGASGETTTNQNFGRPYVTSNSGGNGNSYESDREYLRGSLFGELRARDFSDSDFFVKLFGKHRFTGVFSREDYFTEERAWNLAANSQDWAAYWNGNAGNTSSIQDRPPVGIIYLGSSIAGRDTAAGARVPGITSRVQMSDANAYVFDSTWQNFGVGFGDTWAVPASLSKVFNPTTPPSVGGVQQPSWTQASNPVNYLGWTYRPINLLRYGNGADESLLTRAQMAQRQTTSYALSWQGYLWNEAIIPTIGWRRDEVKGKDVTASGVSTNRSILNLQPDAYRLPDQFPDSQIFEDDSTTYGGVVHVNRLFGERDPLPINVSFSYSKSDNFQVTSTRRDVYGTPISNPTGSTKDYGILLSTKDGKYSFRAIKYETSIKNASASLSNAAGIGGAIQQGLRFRNVFLYDLSVYDWDTRETPASRNTWGGPANAADTSITAEEGRMREDAAITAWNEIQAFLDERGFFEAWGMNPVDLARLTDRSTYEATLVGRDPAAQYLPDPTQVYAYVATAPQGFTVTADTISKGYEFEFTANPLPNWRIAFNASQTEATRYNVGGPVLDELVAFLDSKLFNEDGTVSWAGRMPQFGNTGLSLYNNNYGPWRSNYVQMKLLEGSDAPEIREWRYNVITNYTFQSGFLKNVSVGGSYRWQDKVIIGYPVSPEGNGFTFDLARPYHGPSEDAIDLWFGYERRISERINWRIQLNIRNAFADEGLIPISVQPDGQTWATVRVKPVQEWTLTNTFSF